MDDKEAGRRDKLAEDWLRRNDPEYGESSKAWKQSDQWSGTNRKLFDDPDREVLSNQQGFDGEVKTVAEMADEGIPLVRGVPSRLCEGCFEPFEPEREDGNAQRYCNERCRKRAENRRLRPRKNPPKLRSRGPRRP